MNKNMMNNIGLFGIIVLMITMLIACDSESGGDTTQPPVGTSNLYTWGLNSFGQLGNGNNTNQNTPVAIGTKTWTQVSAGGFHTLAIDSDGHLFAWGGNVSGQLGDGTGGSVGDTSTTSVPIEPTKTWKQVSAGQTHSMAIDNAGRLYAWGGNGFGQFGNGSTTDSLVPVPIGTKTWTQVDAGASFTVAIDTDNHLFTWGDNDKGQLGNNSTTHSLTPVPIESTKTWTQVSAGKAFSGLTVTGYTIAIDSNNRLYAWGDNNKGQLGIGTETVDGSEVLVDKHEPVPVGDGTKTWTQVSAGTGYTVAIDIAGKLYAWGENTYGQLGIGTETVNGSEVLVDKYEPVPVGDGTKTWTQISTKASYTMAIDTAGKLYAWGGNDSGQLGNGNTTNQNTPLEIEPMKTWAQVSTGGYHTLGIIQESVSDIP